jgi:ABC-type dipeptide/oligopeptide/nickel transport system ATPase subunit
VGESGSGKSTIAAAIVDLLRNEAATITGRLVFKGHDIASASAEERRALNGKHIGIVFQDPFTSLNPSLTIGRQVAEPLIQHKGLSSGEAMQRAVTALAEVGLPDPNSLIRAYPHQLSGGMQQRVLIATALICNPELLILDEPTTALDVTVEAQILDLLDRLRRQRQLGMIYITHNWAWSAASPTGCACLYCRPSVRDWRQIANSRSSRCIPIPRGCWLPCRTFRGHRSRGQAVSHSGRVSRPHQAGAGMVSCRPMSRLPRIACRSDRQEIVEAARWSPCLRCWKASAIARHALAKHQTGRSIARTARRYQRQHPSRAPKA